MLRVPHLPERGGDVLASAAGQTAGGGFNVLAAARRLGLPAVYAGGHGTGPFGDLVRTALAGEGITPCCTRAPTGTPDTASRWSTPTGSAPL